MSRQLLAADLNLEAGAYSCGTSQNWINSAQALLIKYNFAGLSNYSPKMTTTDAAAANTLTSQLDAFNNNNFSICPPPPPI